MNVFGTRRRVAMALGTTEEELLGLGVEEKRARELEHLAVDSELQRRLVVRGGNENALLRRHLAAPSAHTGATQQVKR